MLDRLGVRATVATSDDPEASQKIAAFTEGHEPWIVAVRMVSEGVDIPRLAVGVYATNTMTDLFFRQAVGRLVRVSEGAGQQRAYMFIPDDARLRAFASGIAEQRRHSLRKPEKEDDDGFDAEHEEERAADPSEQMSLFSAIKAIPLDEEGNPLDSSPVELDSEPHPWSSDESHVTEADDSATESIPGLVGDDDDATGTESRGDDFRLKSDFDAPVPVPAHEPGTGPSPRSRKRKLREQNSTCVRSLVHRTRLGHAQVNAELNRRAGIRRITEATVEQLERRLVVAEKWLRGD